jgi:hypothetical protein
VMGCACAFRCIASTAIVYGCEPKWTSFAMLGIIDS